MMSLLAALLCLACGFLLVCLGWPQLRPTFSDYLFIASLSVGVGLGVFSMVFFLSLLLDTARFLLVDFVVLALFLIAFFGMRIQRAAVSLVMPVEQISEMRTWYGRLVMTGFAIALGCALYAAAMRLWAYPHGDGWDAFSIWNLRARFLFLGGAHWRDGFTASLPWSHPDYPLLLPAAIAHFWVYLGHDAPAVPAVIGFLFTFSTVALLFAALSLFRGRTPAMLGAIALLATPSFIEQGTSQYADVPLSFFILASIALLCIHDGLAQSELARSDSPQEDRKQTARGPGLLALAGRRTRACSSSARCSWRAWSRSRDAVLLAGTGSPACDKSRHWHLQPFQRSS